MRTELLRLGFSIPALLATSLLFAQERQHLSTTFSDARITVENRAGGDGYVRLRITPVGGAAVETTVDILSRMSENDIAADIEKALTVALSGTYRVDRSGGENVRIRKVDRDATPDFTLEVAFNTPGLTITIED